MRLDVGSTMRVASQHLNRCLARPVGLILSVLLLAGCASTSKPIAAPQKRAKLIRTQAGDQVTLQWDSDATVKYQVIRSRTLDRTQKWTPVSGFEQVMGNGSTITIRFSAPEPGRLYYRLSESPR